ncbi:MAG: hypothetical protein U5L45_09175 [Saprospiraceae bacterium]|nr:hypothetical protein [Saprospiraceae bacterium]
MDKYKKLELLTRRVVRKIARTIVRFPAKWYCNYQFKKSFTNEYDNFWVVDIDNTIADSWRTQTPQYMAQFRSESNRIMSIRPFESMQQFFEDIPPRTRIIFLSARYYIRYFVTKKWLKKHGFWQTDSVLVLVERMRDKAPLLADVLIKFNKNTLPEEKSEQTPQHLRDSGKYSIIFFDDLSYNHEKGKVLFYEDVIEAVKKMPIKYIGYEELCKMQSE